MHRGRAAALVVGVALALATQWRVWDDTPALAVVNGTVAVAFVLTGALLAEYPEQRANGRLMALTGVAWSGVWLDAWNNPVLFVGSDGLANVTVSGRPRPQRVTSAGVFDYPEVDLPSLPKSRRPFFASAGADGDFRTGDDNVYSFEQ